MATVAEIWERAKQNTIDYQAQQAAKQQAQRAATYQEALNNLTPTKPSSNSTARILQATALQAVMDEGVTNGWLPAQDTKAVAASAAGVPSLNQLALSKAQTDVAKAASSGVAATQQAGAAAYKQAPDKVGVKRSFPTGV